MTQCDHSNGVSTGQNIYVCHLPSYDGTRRQIAVTSPESVEALRYYIQGDSGVEPFAAVTYGESPCQCLYVRAAATTEQIRNERWDQIAISTDSSESGRPGETK